MIPPEIREDLAAVLSAVLGHPHVHKALLETGPTGEAIRDAAKRLEQALGESWGPISPAGIVPPGSD